MKKLKRIMIIFMLFATQIMLLGLTFKYVELRDSLLLIDLEAAIEKADPGSNKFDTEETEEEDIIDTDQEKEYVSENNEENTSEEERLIEISINNEDIYYNTKDCKSLEQLKTYLSQEYREGKVVKLKDDYAESNTYKNVLEVLIEKVGKDNIIEEKL